MKVAIGAVGILAGCLFALNTACAGNGQALTAQLHNQTIDEIKLISANWSLGDALPERFDIPAGARANLNIIHPNQPVSEVSFRYSSGNKSCTFRAGHGVKKSFGWFTPTETPFHWANAKSEGSFVASCTATVSRSTPGQEYSVQFSMK
ncbi:hypothetical protein [Pseudomonas sp. NA-150]|uniref:hypothetical protein n=1 Tax=Pseudomonas sp. NA-150 TaxID=3367525 RepID=UPI0037C6D0DE